MTLLHSSTNDLIEELLMWRGRAYQLLDRVAELEEKQRWRVVADGELPEDKLDVLAVSRGGLIISCFIDDYKMWYAPFADRLNVTHWLPLPEPPEVQE